MPKPRRVLPFLFVFAFAAAVAAQGGASKSDPSGIRSPLQQQVAELANQSSWAQDTRYEGAKPDKSKRGVYPVGNGKVFTYVGLGARANTMLAITGPTYAAPERSMPRGNFGELTLELDGAELTEQRVRRVRDANFVVTEDRSESGIALRTLTFAAPDSTVITRVVEVHNGGSAPFVGGVLWARTGIPAQVRGAELELVWRSEGRGAQARIAMDRAEAQNGSLRCKLGDLAPGASFTTVLTVATAAGTEGGTSAATDVATATTAAQGTVRWWRERLRGTPTLRTDNHRIMDLFGDWKVLMLTMRDARSGVVSPMVSRRGAWIRESTGPLLTFLRYNLWAEAKAILDYYHDAICLTGEVREYYPLDLDFKRLAGTKPDYTKIALPDSDLPSWLILQHFWYYRATWDAAYIEQRQPLLLELLRRQKRGKDSLFRFSGHESYMEPTLYRLPLEGFRRNPLFVAEDPAHGRRSYSLGASVAFLMAIQGYGELLNGIDRVKRPDKWAGEQSPDDKPSSKWLERSFNVMKDVERRFFFSDPSFKVREDISKDLKFGVDWTGLFAPAISPVNGTVHAEPFANLNLLPLWMGFTFTTGERSRHNLRNTLARLWHEEKDGKRVRTLVGTTATVGHFTGEVPGMLLTALVERDGRERYQAQQDLMDIAAPAGEWGRFYDPSGRPIASDDPEWPHRMSPNECGINLDAFVFALNGVRHVSVPYFDNTSIKVKLRMPKGCKFLEMENLKKDGRAFSVHVDEFTAPLSEEERKANDAQSDPRYRRDPNVDHRRFRFRMRLLSENPKRGRYQVDADVSGTMFVRYLYKGKVGGQSGEVNESEFWREDHEQFFLDGSPTLVPESKRMAKKAGADLLVLTNRPQCAEILRGDKTTVVDTGLPFTGPELVKALLDGGKPTHKTLLLDVGYDASDRRTFKNKRFWSHPAWLKTLTDFAAGGGMVVRPKYVTRFEVRSGEAGAAWRQVEAADGRLALGPRAPRTAKFSVRCDRDRDDVVVRIGSGCGYALSCAGSELASESGARAAVRDQDSVVATLKRGENAFEVRLAADGDPVLFVQFTDTRGLPVPGLSYE
ncbi:MAG: hypothetical protein H6836_01955 [Planctomycetes bacterium]|nr:hypothetical protein [Planctomycetota bacterium]